jgi:hypothetical protein
VRGASYAPRLRFPGSDSSCGCALPRLLVGSVFEGPRPGSRVRVRVWGSGVRSGRGGDARFFLCVGRDSPFSWHGPREGRIPALLTRQRYVGHRTPAREVGRAPNSGPGGRSGTSSARFEVALLPPTGVGGTHDSAFVRERTNDAAFPTGSRHERSILRPPARKRRILRPPHTNAEPCGTPDPRTPENPTGARTQLPGRGPCATHHHDEPKQRSRRTSASRGSAAAG